MGENTKKAPRTSFYKGLKSEFKKIVWPDRLSVLKQTVAVVLISAVLGALIKLIDMVIQIGLDFII